MFTGRPVLVGHTGCQRGQADKRNSVLGEEEGHGKGRRRQAGRRRLGARPGCLLIGRMGGWGALGQWLGQILSQSKPTSGGWGTIPFPTQMESKANRNPAGPSCDPWPQTQQAPLTLSSPTPFIFPQSKRSLETGSPVTCSLNTTHKMPDSPVQRMPRPCPPLWWLCAKYRGHLC